MNKQNGFSLIELMVTIAIVGIVMSLAAPSFRDLIQNNALVSNTNALVADLQTARGESVKRAVRVTVCPSTAGTACTGSNNWDAGWMVFTDRNGNRTVNAGDGDTVLRIAARASPGITIRAGANATTNHLQYGSTGVVDSGAVTLTVCDARGNTFARGINIIATGRLGLARDTGTDGIVNNVANANVTCP